MNLIGGNRLVLFDPDWNPACLASGTLVATPTNKSVTVDTIRTGDQLVGPNGDNVTVIDVRRGYSGTMFEIRTGVGSHTVTPDHLVTLVCKRDPIVRIIYDRERSDDAILVLIYINRHTLKSCHRYFGCRPLQIDGHVHSLIEFIDPSMHLQADIPIEAPVIVAPVDRILAYANEELLKSEASGEVEVVRDGDFIEITAQELYDRRAELCSHASLRIPLLCDHSSGALECKSRGSSTSLLSVVQMGGSTFVGLQVTGGQSRFALADATICHNCDLQAMSRVWRDGQTRTVYIYRFLCTSTIDEKIHQRQIRKEELSLTMHQQSESVKRNFDTKSLKEIFTYRNDTDCETRDILRKTKKNQIDESDEQIEELGDFHTDLSKALVTSKDKRKPHQRTLTCHLCLHLTRVCIRFACFSSCFSFLFFPQDPLLASLPSHLVSAFQNRVSSLEENRRVLQVMAERANKKLEKEATNGETNHEETTFEDEEEEHEGDKESKEQHATRAHMDTDDGEAEYDLTNGNTPATGVAARAAVDSPSDSDLPTFVLPVDAASTSTQVRRQKRRRRRSIADEEEDEADDNHEDNDDGAGGGDDRADDETPPLGQLQEHPPPAGESDAESMPDWMKPHTPPRVSHSTPLDSAACAVAPPADPPIEIEYTLDSISGGAKPIVKQKASRRARIIEDDDDEEPY